MIIYIYIRISHRKRCACSNSENPRLIVLCNSSLLPLLLNKKKKTRNAESDFKDSTSTRISQTQEMSITKLTNTKIANLFSGRLITIMITIRYNLDSVSHKIVSGPCGDPNIVVSLSLSYLTLWLRERKGCQTFNTKV
ncbi:predicted protein [Candida tropicalis MYA-3404]|uniref:Uncharacterized protein n=1 Tax=Candida tropicalis (strain ATCC MYA-3404 / T1) TaxID=294747 RepID=C5MB35_CANTT|nr:predicted protein [Candida tropicalis MYA-3404]EER32852.1 predicted protein [Candida tropicalis MYA-3404]KAG4406679.1 hypothetical protein JTP64_004063 [Candida tropicalis]